MKYLKLTAAAWVVMLGGCGSFHPFGIGATSENPQSPVGSGLIPTLPSGTFAPIGSVGGLCILLAVGLWVAQMRKEAFLSLSAGIGLLLCKSLLDRYALALTLLGIAVVLFLLAKGTGNFEERLKALFGAWRLEAKGKLDEATALRRIWNPKLDRKYKAESKAAKARTGSSAAPSSDSQSSAQPLGGSPAGAGN